RKYARVMRQYEEGLASISSTKKSKREHAELLERRKFARNFCDFRDVSGETHIVLQPEILDLVIKTMDEIGRTDLLDEVIANSAQFVKKNAVEFTSNPARFARLIQLSIEDSRLESILRAIFEAPIQDFPQIQLNLANAAYETLSDNALMTLVDIAELNKSY